MSARSSRSFVLLVSLLCSASACAPERTQLVYPELFEDISWAALVLEEPGGTIIGTTGLVQVKDSKLELEVPGENGSTVTVYAYRDQDLPPEVPRDPALLRVPLASAQIEEPVLPAPTLQVRADLVDGAPFVPDTKLRDLTAPWIPSCPTLGSTEPEASVLVSCVARSCRPFATQSDCRLRVDVSGTCGLGTVDVKLLPRGEAETRVTEGPLGPCRSTTPHAGADLALLCDRDVESDCRIDLYPRAARTQIEISARTKLVPEAPDSRSNTPPLIGDLMQLDADELVVSLSGEPVCTLGGANELRFLDRQTLELTRTATTSECVQSFFEDPTGAGFLGMTRAPVAMVRYDRDGRLLERRLVEGLTPIDDPTPIASSVSLDGRSAAVWVTSPTRDGRTQNDFVQVDLEDLSTIAVMPWSGDSHFPIALIPGGFAFVDDDVDMLRYYDRVGGRELNAVSLVADSLTNRAFWGMIRIGDTNRLTIFINSEKDAVALVDEEQRVLRLNDNELSMPPYSGAPLPDSPSRLLLGAGYVDGAAELVVFDAIEARFLPGVTATNIEDLPLLVGPDGREPSLFVYFRHTTDILRVRVAP